MKIIVTTSNNYLHLLPVFIYLYNKYWGAPCTIVGYDKPDFELPDNITFHSMGVQGDKKEFSTDLRKYFESIEDEYFIWLMEDTLIQSEVDAGYLKSCEWQCVNDGCAKFCLTRESMRRGHVERGLMFTVFEDADYRLSTQPAIWRKEFLLQYLTPGLSPWDFETQHPKNDGWFIEGVIQNAIHHNEGVRRFDLYKLDLTGMDQEDIDHIKTITDKW